MSKKHMQVRKMSLAEYLIETVGEKTAKKILESKCGDYTIPIYIPNDHIPATGKTYLKNILEMRGYTVFEEHEVIKVEMLRKAPIPADERDGKGVLLWIED